MDGVLTDFEKRAKETVPSFKGWDTHDDHLWSTIEGFGWEWWATLPPMEGAEELWYYLENLQNRYGLNVQILSSGTITSYDIAKKGKIKWLRDTISDNIADNALIVRGSKEKSKYATPSAILIDDFEENYKSWVEAGGIGIVHSNFESTTKQLESIFT